MTKPKTVAEDKLKALTVALAPLIGVQFDVLKIPKIILSAFEPSQIGTIAGALMDACIPRLTEIVAEEDRAKLKDVGLSKSAGILKDREGYPDYEHDSGLRAELKLLYVDPVDVKMKKIATPREPSARLTQKVTTKNVIRDRDVLLFIAYQLKPDKTREDLYVPTIVDFLVVPVADCIDARDARLIDAGGNWFGNYEVPAVLSKIGKKKLRQGKKLKDQSYGRKESEGFDYNEDTNFGKMARIPYKPLRDFIKKFIALDQVALEDDGATTLDEEIKQATSNAAKIDVEIQK